MLRQPVFEKHGVSTSCFECFLLVATGIDLEASRENHSTSVKRCLGYVSENDFIKVDHEIERNSQHIFLIC